MTVHDDDCEVCFRPPNWRHVDHVYQPRDSSGYGIHKPAELDELMAATRAELTTAQEAHDDHRA